MSFQDGQTKPGQGWLPRRVTGQQPESIPQLVLCWSLEDEPRAGELLLLGDRGVVGRGAPRDDDPAPRSPLVRDRPGQREERPWLSSPGLSRQQLLIERAGDELRVRRLGQAGLRVSGQKVDEGVVRIGDTLMLEGEVLFVCVERPVQPYAQRAPAPAFSFGRPDAVGIVGESPRAHQLRDEIRFFGRCEGHVLVNGPSGAGKELTSRAVHLASPRASGPFVARNAATLPSGIIDAELYGNAANYPNAGMRERRGLIGEADKGTLFLDEIGEIPDELQAHLLRVLDSGEYHRLGDPLSRRSDLRLIGATNRPDEALRTDLLHRLKLRLQVPGLDERRDDIAQIAYHLVDAMAARDPSLRARFFEPSGLPRLDPSLVEMLVRHEYTGHVRELEGMLELSVAKSTEHFIALSPEVRRRISLPVAAPRRDEPPSKQEIEAALAQVGGSPTKAWQLLGLSSRDALNRLMKKHGINARKP